jgi:hypothetical protein
MFNFLLSDKTSPESLFNNLNKALIKYYATTHNDLKNG